MKKRKNRLFTWFLAALLAFGIMPASALPSLAGDVVNVSTADELKDALITPGDKTVKLTADVLYDLNQPIDIKGNKTLKLSGHKIEITTWNGFHLSTGADLKIDGEAGGGEIVLAQQGSLFYMNGGSLTIDGGSYVVFDPISIVVLIDISTAGGKVEINGGSFQDIRGKVIYSRSEKSANPPQVVINGGIFTSNIESVWKSADSDVTGGTVNGGTFYSMEPFPAFDFGDTGNKFLGDAKYLVMDGEHNANRNLWELKGSCIQVGNNASDFVNVTMNAAAGGKGYFFKGGWDKTAVLAMKNGFLPVLAVPDAGKILSVWEKEGSSAGEFVDKSLMNAYYIPQAVSTLKPNFAAAPQKPTLGIVGTYTYNGRAQTANVTSYAPATMRIEGNRKIGAGKYTISVFPKGPKWADGTAEPATVEWTIEKASCTGAPTCTKITEAGKTLADVALNTGTILPAGGELKWDDPLTTAVVQETEYAWTYTPIDDKNYEKLKGSLTPWGAEVVDVGTPEELKNAMELERKVIVNLTAEIVYSLDSSINVSGNKDLKLNGHKIENEGRKFLFNLSGGCNLKIDGTVQGSGITAKNNSVPVIFNMVGGVLTIDGGGYTSFKDIVDIGDSSKDAKLEINDGHFQVAAPDCGILHSQSRESSNPPNIHINGGTFVSEGFVWTTTDFDKSEGVVNGGCFYSKGAKKVFNFRDTDRKYLGAGKYLVMEGEHNNNSKLWELKGSFIQVGNDADDFVNVTMNAVAGGKGFFFKKDGKEDTVSAMKNKILPVVAAPDSGCNFSGWVKLAGTGDFVENNLASTCYIPVAASQIKPTFTGGGGGSGGGGGGSGGGGGGGDAGGSAPTYAVSVEKTENGSVTSSHASAAEGTTVVLTVTPDKGYVLDMLTVLDSKDNEISAAKNAGKYSFKMPGRKVSVKAAFKKGEEKPDGDAADNKAKFTDVKDSDYFAKAVAWAVEKGITTGTSAATFSPHAPCTRAQTVTFLWRAAGKPEPQKTDNPFADVKADAYYNKALLWAVEQGIVKGTSATAFSPDATCTRGQMAAILYRYAKSPTVKGDKSFADVKADAYYANAVKWTAEQGITAGTGATSFSPDATCTRAQIVTFLYRYMGR